MKRYSMKNLSLLGLVLMGASAVTAAILPKEKANAFRVSDGALANSIDGASNAQKTCIQQVGANECDFTANDQELSYSSASPALTSAAGLTTEAGVVNTGDFRAVANGPLITN
jgi:hypothetical protein